ncbi:MAG: class I SAM-dependent methyltransferase [Gammaproteobacteria bacterium]|nr:class I SAM-dependent methyltransferase [Gammaproteobacteria bacterium]
MKIYKPSAPIWTDAQEPLSQWYASGLGQSMLAQVEQRLGDHLSDVFGYQGLQVGNLCSNRDLLERAGLHRKIVFDAPGRDADINGDALQLPVAADTMKAVIFLHTLDFCDNPHQALREADRVLAEDGQLFIVGFNPISSFGLRHFLTGWRQREPWNGRFYFRRRVIDWLSVLNYRTLQSEAVFLRPPINSHRLLWSLRRLESLSRIAGGIGGVYLIQARKQTIPMTLTRKAWRRHTAGVATGSIAREQATSRVVKLEPKKDSNS